MIGAAFNYTGAFQLINASFNARNFSGGAAGAANSEVLQIYWDTIHNVIVAVNRSGIIVYELAAGSLVYANVAGAVNAYTANVPSITALAAGATFEGNITAPTNTGAATLNVSGLGALPIVDYDGNALIAGSLEIDSVYIFIYNATLNAWELAGLASPALPTLIGNVAVVSAANGNDATAVVGSWTTPFLTVQAAITAAVAGQSVLVLPGTYAEAITPKTGVPVVGLDKADTIISGTISYAVAGTYDFSNITLTNPAGNVAAISSANLITANFNNAILSVTGGNVINYTNTNAATTVNVNGGSMVLNSVGAGELLLNTGVGSLGIINLKGVSTQIPVASPDAVVTAINGGVNVFAAESNLFGQYAILGTATLRIINSVMQAATVAVITTTSTGATDVINSLLQTAAASVVSGAGVFFYANVSFGTGSQVFDAALNAGSGPRPSPVAAIRLGVAPLVGIVDGRVNYDGTNFDVQIGVGTSRLSKQALSGTTAALSGAGVDVIADARVTAASIILVSHNTFGGVPSILSAPIAAIVPGVSFTITGSAAGDTSTVNYAILNPGV